MKQWKRMSDQEPGLDSLIVCGNEDGEIIEIGYYDSLEGQAGCGELTKDQIFQWYELPEPDAHE